MIDRLDDALDTLTRLYLAICQGLLGLLVAGVLFEVVWRYAFSRSLLGLAELTALALVWIVFLMAVVLHRRRRHIVITAAIDLAGPRMKSVAAALVSLGTILLAAFVCYQLYRVWPFLRLRTPVFGIHDVAYKLAPLFAFVPISLQELVNLAKLGRKGR